MADVTLEVIDEGNVKLVRAHKSILAARSPFFEKLFCSGFQEKSQDTIRHDSKLPIKAFTAMVEYLYSGDLSRLSPVDCYNLLLEGAAYYMIDSEELNEFCTKSIQQELSVANCVDMYLLGCKSDNFELKQKSMEIIAKHYDQVIQKVKSIQDVHVQVELVVELNLHLWKMLNKR